REFEADDPPEDPPVGLFALGAGPLGNFQDSQAGICSGRSLNRPPGDLGCHPAFPPDAAPARPICERYTGREASTTVQCGQISFGESPFPRRGTQPNARPASVLPVKVAAEAARRFLVARHFLAPARS